MEKGRKDVYLIQTMLVSLISACIIFGYFIFKSRGFFTVVDDFNSQQLPFATAVWNMFHSGDAGEWSWNIDLGSSFITTFSFYDLGSPFIWLSLLAPRGVFPYLAGFLYITINEQIPKSAQTPLFTLREHFEQKSLVKHNF